MIPTSRYHAIRNLRAHAFALGHGYLAFAPHEFPIFGPVSALLDAPVGAEDGSVHLLQPPSGGIPLRFQWVMIERAWTPYPVPDILSPGHWPITHRRPLAYSSAFLGSHGWSYVGSAKDADPVGTFYWRAMQELP